MKRVILENLQRRKDGKINPCDNCEATGRVGEKVCAACLGQGVLLSRLEYDYLLEIAGFAPAEYDDDSILGQQYFEYDSKRES